MSPSALTCSVCSCSGCQCLVTRYTPCALHHCGLCFCAVPFTGGCCIRCQLHVLLFSSHSLNFLCSSTSLQRRGFCLCRGWLACSSSTCCQRCSVRQCCAVTFAFSVIQCCGLRSCLCCFVCRCSNCHQLQDFRGDDHHRSRPDDPEFQ